MTLESARSPRRARTNVKTPEVGEMGDDYNQSCDCASPTIVYAYGRAMRGSVPITMPVPSADESPYMRPQDGAGLEKRGMRGRFVRAAVVIGAVAICLALVAVVYRAFHASGVGGACLGASPSPENGRCFVLYHSHSCPHCKDFMPVYDEVSSRYSGRARFEKMLPSDKEVSVQFYPTVKYFDAGREGEKHVGASSTSQFETFVRSCLG